MMSVSLIMKLIELAYNDRFFVITKNNLFMLFQGVRNLSIETASVTAGAAVTTAAADA